LTSPPRAPSLRIVPSRSLVLANLGTPAAPTPAAVRAFLEEFLSDPLVVDYPGWLWRPILRRLVLRRRPDRIAEAYRAIWRPAGSPLADDTVRLVAAVGERLRGERDVVPAYRYGARSLSRVVGERIAAGDADIAVMPLFPQRTSSSSGSIVEEAKRLAAGSRARLRVVEIPPDAPGYVAAVADRVCATFAAGEPEHLLVSYHGIPTRYDRRESGLYRRDCERTTAALLEALAWPEERSTHAYQSRFGPEPWIGPATAERIAALAGHGVRRLAVVTPGFLTDGLETLEEIGLRGSEAFREAGGERLAAVPAAADHPRLADEIAALIRASR
jgi:ferrochelatase